MVSVCLPSDALSQHLSSVLAFSYLGCGVSLHGCSSKAQPLFFTLDEGYLLTITVPDLQCGIAPLGPPVPAQPPLLQKNKWITKEVKEEIRKYLQTNENETTMVENLMDAAKEDTFRNSLAFSMFQQMLAI